MAAVRTDTYLHFERNLDRYLGPVLLFVVRLWARLKPGRHRSVPQVPEKILLIKFHGIGNMVMMMPAIRAIRRQYPEASLHLLTFDTNREISAMLPGLDHTAILTRKNLWQLAYTTMQFIFSCRRAPYDIVVDFEQFAYFSAILSILAAPGGTRVGYDNPAHRRAAAYTHPVTYLENSHMAEIFLGLARSISAGDMEDALSLPVPPAGREKAAMTMEKMGIGNEDVLVLIHPGTSRNLLQRRWPPERFAKLADGLTAHQGIRIAFTGTSSEKELVKSIMEQMDNPSLDLSGELDLSGYSALCAASELIIANDTAAVHIANALGTPVVGLYGPNTPFLYGPANHRHCLVFYKDLPCSPCMRNANRKLSDCDDPLCMKEISAGEVMAGIRNRYFDAAGRILPAYKKVRTPGKQPNMAKPVA
jgi:ADP-heptose:LPS heptosyltransferase